MAEKKDLGHVGIDPGIQILVDALNEAGASTEASCEGHIEHLATGEPCVPCVPYVVFRSSAEFADAILEIAWKLYYDPEGELFLHGWWHVESCPAPEGGILRTLTLHPRYLLGGMDGEALARAQQDVRTLAEQIGTRVRHHSLVDRTPGREPGGGGSIPSGGINLKGARYDRVVHRR
jgi:hypothetical protein